tara:strand:- start:3615 stop:5480 length:1866 start_codon:yes stop_codon:yes gene_type:complete
MQGFESRLSSKISWPLFFCFLVGCSEQKKVSISIKNSDPDLVSGMVVAPGIKEGKIIAPLEDAWRRIDPKEDGWDSEVFNEIATKKLKNLSKIMKESNLITEKDLQGIQGNDYTGNFLRPRVLEEVYRNDEFIVKKGNIEKGTKVQLKDSINDLLSIFDVSPQRIAFKLYRIDQKDSDIENNKDVFKGRVLVNISGSSAASLCQINSEWETLWTLSDESFKLNGINVLSYEQVARAETKKHKLFVDITSSVFGNDEAYRKQFLKSTDHWRSRIARDFGLDVVANHGIAFGDVNGDRLDDMYVCQQGGLPNRLFIRQTDGTLKDFTESSNTGWLDYCASALILDFDNDGDRDIAISQNFKILFMDNLGNAKFELALGLGTHAQTFSISAADYDNDGDLDIFLCGYNPPASLESESGVMGEPMPYHDAKNGGKNKMLRNDGDWNFTEVTEESGLNQNNDRFSFASSWHDYDRDGDLDLYVANDYGRNNLYQNNGGKFVDVAKELGVEDMSAGMSVSWGDYNRDGFPDLYVSNMFSSAGNRITYQRQFKSGVDSNLLSDFRRHARGNSLFQAVSGKSFKDVSEAVNVTMGRWAWGSRFADIDNDGWLDILVANGFITAPDSGDL